MWGVGLGVFLQLWWALALAFVMSVTSLLTLPAFCPRETLWSWSLQFFVLALGQGSHTFEVSRPVMWNLEMFFEAHHPGCRRGEPVLLTLYELPWPCPNAEEFNILTSTRVTLSICVSKLQIDTNKTNKAQNLISFQALDKLWFLSWVATLGRAACRQWAVGSTSIPGADGATGFLPGF